MWEFSHFKDRFIQTKTISVFFFSIADRKKQARMRIYTERGDYNLRVVDRNRV
ncbi:hypothetical protein LEP1GSC125_3843 [Leptospira mayottensis 200901122]|uniref:Uncharacterized protein n=1 Tax=Leptospira mayottensis 200901122 TaxID=1193010 RepID=A0AA87MRL1_9LEPT|nr:hypothetical protein LEP1GSC125_3843 [Leptospira mayottensis 200901122]